MAREPLDSIEYESTYLELRPVRECGMTDAVVLTARLVVAELDARAVASNGLGGRHEVSVETLSPCSIPATPAFLPRGVQPARLNHPTIV